MCATCSTLLSIKLSISIINGLYFREVEAILDHDHEGSFGASRLRVLVIIQMMLVVTREALSRFLALELGPLEERTKESQQTPRGQDR